MKQFSIEEEIKKLFAENTLVEEIEIRDIPNIDLYVDQVTTFMDESLKNLKRHESDKIMTKTMINNYTKDKLLPPPHNKKYSKNHVMMLIILYHLKSVLSISDINTLLDSINDVEKDYMFEFFNAIKRNSVKDIENELLSEILSIIEKFPDYPNYDFEKKNKLQMFMVAVMLSVKADTNKRLAERIIDRYFKE